MKKIFLALMLVSTLIIQTKADVIKDVKLENSKRISKESIIAFGNIKLGKDYSELEINQILLDLYETNFFSDIRLKVENNILIINVDEKKIIQTILLEGIKSKENTANILKQLSLKDKSPFDKFTAEQDLIKIKSALSRSGYYFAKVDVKIKDNNNDTIDLIYNIDIGEKALITNETRKANVVAITDVECLVLDRTNFQAMLAEVEEKMTDELSRRRKDEEAVHEHENVCQCAYDVIPARAWA